MEEVKLEECCLENKQSTAASSSSVSEGSGSAILKSPGVCSPASTSPTHRYSPLLPNSFNLVTTIVMFSV